MKPNPVRLVREATGKTREQFFKMLGISRKSLWGLETGKQKLSQQMQARILAKTGAWIGIRNHGKTQILAPPVALGYGIDRGGWSLAPDFGPGESKGDEFTSESFRRHWSETEADPETAFLRNNSILSFWLSLLIAASIRAGKGQAIRAELTAMVYEIAREHDLYPAMAGILREIEPVCPQAAPAARDRIHAFRPHGYPPPWLRAALDLAPLSLFVRPPRTKAPEPVKAARAQAETDRQHFRCLLEEDPKQAREWVSDRAALRARYESFYCQLEQIAEGAAGSRQLANDLIEETANEKPPPKKPARKATRRRSAKPEPRKPKP